MSTHSPATNALVFRRDASESLSARDTGDAGVATKGRDAILSTAEEEERTSIIVKAEGEIRRAGAAAAAAAARRFGSTLYRHTMKPKN